MSLLQSLYISALFSSELDHTWVLHSAAVTFHDNHCCSSGSRAAVIRKRVENDENFHRVLNAGRN